jgi:hypothetical protein
MSFHYAASACQYDFAEPDLEGTWLHADLLRKREGTDYIMPIANPLPMGRMAIIATLAVVAWMPFIAVYLAGR